MRPHSENKRFYNHEGEKLKGFVIPTAYMYLRSLFGGKYRRPRNAADWVAQEKPVSCSLEPRVTWIGHASFLIQVGNLNIITDPVFGNASFLFNRILPPGISVAQLPNIDFVLLSHNHIDHMDAKSLFLLKGHSGITMLVPHGDKAWFDRRGFERARELTWWEQYSTTSPDGKNVRFTFLPAAHWSQRGFFDKNKSLWGSWMIEYNAHTLYFAGDTAYSNHFKAIGHEFSAITTALMPIGPCEPRSLMQHSHLDAHQAGTAFLELGAQNFIPMHWGTFSFGLDRFDTPIVYMRKWWDGNRDHLGDKRLHVVKAGQPVRF